MGSPGAILVTTPTQWVPIPLKEIELPWSRTPAFPLIMGKLLEVISWKPPLLLEILIPRFAALKTVLFAPNTAPMKIEDILPGLSKLRAIPTLALQKLT